MSDEEKFDRLAAAIERMATAVDQRLGSLERAHLGLVAQVGILADITRQVVTQVDTLAQQQAALAQQQAALAQQQATLAQQQAALAQRQAEQDQRFEVLLGELRHIIQRLDGGSPNP
ncbi:MAG: hypothetical protein Q6K70_07420 [Thermostichales cyanobacterium DRC_bins_46]